MVAVMLDICAYRDPYEGKSHAKNPGVDEARVIRAHFPIVAVGRVKAETRPAAVPRVARIHDVNSGRLQRVLEFLLGSDDLDRISDVLVVTDIFRRVSADRHIRDQFLDPLQERFIGELDSQGHDRMPVLVENNGVELRVPERGAGHLARHRPLLGFLGSLYAYGYSVPCVFPFYGIWRIGLRP